VTVGALPQMLAWKAIYGEYLLPYPPQGTEFLRLSRPFLLNTLFSSRHGLLSWTPVFWLCFAGLVLLTLKNPRRFGILWAPLMITTYVNACTGDWWSGGAFSGRRFDSVLPIFALGLAAFLRAAMGFLKRRPSAVLAAFVIAGATWNLTFVRALQSGEVPPDALLTLGARTLASTRALSHDAGFPTTWPASWIFAARYNTSPDRFDLAAGKYLFYRQNNLGGIADLGSEGDAALILDGFSAPRQDGSRTYRALTSQARLVVSLDLPETLEISFDARTSRAAGATVDVFLNGRAVGAITPESNWSERTLEAPQAFWKRGPNVLALKASSELQLDVVTFRRAER
jgi:hypothetical protein